MASVMSHFTPEALHSHQEDLLEMNADPILPSLQWLPSGSGPCVLIFYYASTGATLFFSERCPFPGMFAQGPLWNALPSDNPGDSLLHSLQVFK